MYSQPPSPISRLLVFCAYDVRAPFNFATEGCEDGGYELPIRRKTFLAEWPGTPQRPWSPMPACDEHIGGFCCTVYAAQEPLQQSCSPSRALGNQPYLPAGSGSGGAGWGGSRAAGDAGGAAGGGDERLITNTAFLIKSRALAAPGD